MKFGLNTAFTSASGGMDGWVYRTIRGQVIAAHKPNLSNVVYSENQIAHRARFKKATVYGKSAMANAEVRALYDAAAKARNLPIFALMIADYFNAPVIHEVDVFGYTGNIGDTINILASDDFEVAKVHVMIADTQGNPIENGEAVETAPGSGEWIYTATVQGQPLVKVQVVAVDRPGGTAVMNIDKTF